MGLKLPSRPPSAETVRVRAVGESGAVDREDRIAVEEPLEIRLAWGPPKDRLHKSVSVTMRTPGEDFELALGLLFAEGILGSAADVESVERCGPPAPGREQSNVVRVSLVDTVDVDLRRLQRNFFSSSSCGICGKASLEALDLDLGNVELGDGPVVAPAVLHGLGETLRAAQSTFEQTGGLHAAALFEPDGTLVSLYEDVGRHNAVDKLVGAALMEKRVPLSDYLMMVSGRTSYEILQKAVAAGLPLVAAVGAPSSLAVELARRFGMTLVGFLRDGRFNVYSGEERLLLR